MTEETAWPSKDLVADDNYGPVLKTKIIGTAADLVAGTVVGRITASGKLVAYAAGNANGSETPVGVLMEDAAAAAADVEAVVGFAGVYRSDNVTGLDAAGELALEARGIYFV